MKKIHSGWRGLAHLGAGTTVALAGYFYHPGAWLIFPGTVWMAYGISRIRRYAYGYID